MSSIFDDAFSAFGPGNASNAGTVSIGDSGNFPVFDATGSMMGNLTSAQGQAPVTLPNSSTLPNVGGAGSAAFQGVAGAASAAGITGGSIPPAATTGTTSNTSGALNNWFVRAVIVILGFVFVAVGLSQFGVVQKLRP